MCEWNTRIALIFFVLSLGAWLQLGEVDESNVGKLLTIVDLATGGIYLVPGSTPGSASTTVVLYILIPVVLALQ